MNAITFEIKQAHIRATWKAIGIFKATAILWKAELLDRMTPARFDLMEAVYLYDEPDHQRRAETGVPAIARWRDMAGLVRILGLAASTVSRSVRQLASFGWVEIKRTVHDKRLVDVYLTDTGLEALALAKQCLGNAPREMPAISDEECAYDRTIPANGRGMNVRTRDLVCKDRSEEGQAESRFIAWQESRSWMALYDEVATYHYFRVVDHFRRIARFFGSRARPLHDPRDATLFVLHAEKEVEPIARNDE